MTPSDPEHGRSLPGPQNVETLIIVQGGHFEIKTRKPGS